MKELEGRLRRGLAPMMLKSESNSTARDNRTKLSKLLITILLILVSAGVIFELCFWQIEGVGQETFDQPPWNQPINMERFRKEAETLIAFLEAHKEKSGTSRCALDDNWAWHLIWAQLTLETITHLPKAHQRTILT